MSDCSIHTLWQLNLHLYVFFLGFLCVNDSSVSRTSRLRKVLRSYVPKQYLTDEKLRVTTLDGTNWGEVERNVFDRVNSVLVF